MRQILVALIIALALSGVAAVVLETPADSCPRHNPRC